MFSFLLPLRNPQEIAYNRSETRQLGRLRQSLEEEEEGNTRSSCRALVCHHGHRKEERSATSPTARLQGRIITE